MKVMQNLIDSPLICKYVIAKLANGLADNLLTCTARAWNAFDNPFIIAPAMNSDMYKHPITNVQLETVQKFGIKIIPPVEKKLM